MSLIDFIKRRTHVVQQERNGINLAINVINTFQDRAFTFKGLKDKYSGLSSRKLITLIQEELDNMLILYSYTTKIKTYIDKNGVSQAEIKLLGRAGVRTRYNPLDVELNIKTEKPEQHKVESGRF